MHVDVFSFTQNGKQTISFMSQALGLMADLDVGTEDLRWMGDSRFVYGLLRGRTCLFLIRVYSSSSVFTVIKFKPCDVELSYKIVEKDKRKMFENLKLRDKTESDARPTEPIQDDSSTLPELKISLDDQEGWTTFQEPLLYLYAGKGPYVGR